MNATAHCRQVFPSGRFPTPHAPLPDEGKINLAVKQVFERKAVFLYQMIVVGHAQMQCFAAVGRLP